MIKTYLSFFTFLIIVFSNQLDAQIFVSPAGDDNNPGTFDFPGYLTLKVYRGPSELW